MGHDPPRPHSLAPEVELGHTDQELLFRHYRELVKPEQAAKWWDIRPATQTNLMTISASGIGFSVESIVADMSQPTKVNQAAFDIGQMTERMAQGYATHVAAIQNWCGNMGPAN